QHAQRERKATLPAHTGRTRRRAPQRRRSRSRGHDVCSVRPSTSCYQPYAVTAYVAERNVCRACDTSRACGTGGLNITANRAGSRAGKDGLERAAQGQTRGSKGWSMRARSFVLVALSAVFGLTAAASPARGQQTTNLQGRDPADSVVASVGEVTIHERE